MSSKFFVSVLVCLLLLPLAAALSEDFEAMLVFDKLCANEPGSGSLVIKNSGQLTSSYELTLTKGASYAILAKNTAELEPGQHESIPIFFNGPRGRHTLEVAISSRLGLTKTISSSFELEGCPNIELSLLSAQNASCPCETASYVLELRNSGGHEESYALAIKPADWVTMSSDFVSLAPGQTAQLAIWITPSCDATEVQRFELSVRALKSGYEAILPFFLDLRSCYPYKLGIPNMSLCNHELALFELELANSATNSNIFALTLSGPDWLSLTPANASLAGNSKVSFVLTANASEAEPGSYTGLLEIDVARGQPSKQGFEIVVERCHGLDLELPKKVQIIAGQLESIPVSLLNSGSRSANYTLTLEAADWFKLSKKSVSVAPGESTTAEIIANVPRDAQSQERWAGLTAQQDGKLSQSALIEFEIVSREEAFALVFDRTRLRTNYEPQTLTVELRHTGLLPANYSFFLEGPAWLSLLTKSVELEPGQSAQLELRSSPPADIPEEGYALRITAQPAGEDFGYQSNALIWLVSAPWWVKAGNQILDFLRAYILYIGAGLAALALLCLVVFGTRAAARAVRARKQSVAQALLEAARAEAAAPLRLSVSRVQKRSALPKLLGSVFAVIALVGLGWLVWLNSPSIAALASSALAGLGAAEQEPAQLVFAEQGHFSLPLIIENVLERPVSYAIDVSDTPWLSPKTKKLELSPRSNSTLELDISALDQAMDYSVLLLLEVPESNHSEALEVEIARRRSVFTPYRGYIAAGLAVAALLMVLAFVRRNPFKLKQEVLVLERRRGGRAKKILLVALLCLVVVALAGSAAWLLLTQDRPSLDLEQEHALLELAPGERITLPLTFVNSYDEGVRYELVSDTDWITIDGKHSATLELGAGESTSLNVSAAPSENETGFGQLSITSYLAGQRLSYTKVIELRVLQKQSALGRIAGIIVAAVLAMILIALSLSLRARLARRAAELESLRKELQAEVAQQPAQAARARKQAVKAEKKPRARARKLRLSRQKAR